MDEHDTAPESTPPAPAARTVEYDKFSRVVAAKQGLERQVEELRAANQALEERVSGVDALASQLSQAQQRALEAEQRFTRYQTISSVVGSTESDVVEAFEWQYSRLGDDKPALSEWVSALKSDPSTAPAVLRPWLAAPEPPAPEPPTRRPSPSAGHEQPHGAPSKYSPAEIKAAREDGLLRGDWTKWLAMRKDMGIE